MLAIVSHIVHIVRRSFNISVSNIFLSFFFNHFENVVYLKVTTMLYTIEQQKFELQSNDFDLTDISPPERLRWTSSDAVKRHNRNGDLPSGWNCSSAKSSGLCRLPLIGIRTAPDWFEICAARVFSLPKGVITFTSYIYLRLLQNSSQRLQQHFFPFITSVLLISWLLPELCCCQSSWHDMYQRNYSAIVKYCALPMCTCMTDHWRAEALGQTFSMMKSRYLALD